MATTAEILNQLLHKNESNQRKILSVSSNFAKNTFANDYVSSQASTSIISPSSGNKICIFGYIIHASGNFGEISLEFSGGGLIGTCYSSTENKIKAHNINLEGPVDEDIEVNGGGDSFFVLVNYGELEG